MISTLIKQWLNDRGISDEVIFHNNIQSDARNNIVIPVYDPFGIFLFNKYRRNPLAIDGPKYRYDPGATTALYNMNNCLIPSETIFIVEGELDALCLQSRGYYAVSTTGGAGSFNPDWADWLKGRKIYICYDNDLAGMQGTLRLLDIFPDAYVVLLPRKGGIKDVTDFLQKYALQVFASLVKEAQQWRLPRTKEECSDAAEIFEAERQHMLMQGLDCDFANVALAHVTAIYDSFKALEKKKAATPPVDGDALERARMVHISEFLKLDGQKNALCINHADTHPSMHYFKRNNRVKCFVCGFSEDTIGVVQKLFNLSVGDAIKKINGT